MSLSFIPLLLVLLLLPFPSLAQAPDPVLSTAESESGHLLMAPGGGIESLAEAGLTITVILRDGGGAPLASVAADRIRLDASTPAQLEECPAGNIADGPTDANGTTTFSGVLAGGGFTAAGLRVYVDGVPLDSLLDIEINSADLDGDLAVGITDVSLLATNLGPMNPYAFRSELWRDDVIDIADVAVFALFLGDACDP